MIENGNGSQASRNWKVCGADAPRSELVFFSQVVIIYDVVCLCLYIWRRDEEIRTSGAHCWAVVSVICYPIPRTNKNDARFLSYSSDQQLDEVFSKQHALVLRHETAATVRHERRMGSVGLSEVQFPMTWYNLNENESRLHVTMFDENQQFVQAFVSPPVGHYEHPKVLVKQINDSIAKIELFARAIRFSYNEISRKITIAFNKRTIGKASLKILKGLAELWGYEYSKLDNIVLLVKEKSSFGMQSLSNLANNVVETLFELSNG